ncbi:hypothetical protein FRC12_023361 [Ceratobasidium sp. 428]|nr:hypothetical protein FRC12_023361 [Ceratobasidium sp. 428]
MPPSIFTAKEREFIASYLEEWLELSGAGKVRDGDGELFSPKDELVDTIKLDFFVAFPERELSDGAQSPTAFSIPDRDRLHTRIKHILYNAAAKQDRLDSQRSQGPTLSRHTAYLTLFKQQYRTEIMQRRDAHLPDGTPKEKLIAYNQAVQEERKYREAICPEEIHKLKAQAQNIRAQAKLPFHRQSSEVQAIVLDNLPSNIARAMRGWEHQTGAHIFLTVVWSNEKHEATVFDYSTRNAKGFLTSENAKDAQQAWHMWLEQFKGTGIFSCGDRILSSSSGDLLNKATEVPKEEIYANAAGLPMLPEIYGSRVSMADQKKLMRRYFECWSMTRGGGKVPYARIERDMREDPASWIDPARMPPGVHTLTDIKVWTPCRAASQSGIRFCASTTRGETGSFAHKRAGSSTG